MIMRTDDPNMKENLPVVLEFYAPWSEACKRQLPVMQEVRDITGDRARILRVDIDQYAELARQYGVYTVPAVLIFMDGRVIWRKNGPFSASEILEHLTLLV